MPPYIPRSKRLAAAQTVPDEQETNKVPSPKGAVNRVPDWIQNLAAIGLRVAGPWAGTTVGALLGGTAGAPAAGVGAVPGGIAGAMAGGATGAAIAEPFAQYIEPGGGGRSDKGFNWGRAAVNTALGAVPAKLATGIGKGAAIGYGAIAGDKYLAQGKTANESLNPTQWSPLEVAMGPVMGGTVGGTLERLGGGRQPTVAPSKTVGTVRPVGKSDSGGTLWRVQPDKPLKEPKLSPNESYNVTQEASKSATPIATREAKRIVAKVKQSLAQAGQDTRPSDNAATQPTDVTNVVMNEPSATSGRFAVANPETARGLEAVPDGQGLVYSAQPEVPSEATTRALSKPTNPRMATQQAARNRQTGAQTARQEVAADVANAKTIVKDTKTAETAALKAARDKERVLSNTFKSALQRKEGQAGQVERLEDQFSHADARRNVQFADEQAKLADEANAQARVQDFLNQEDVKLSEPVLVDSSTVNEGGRTQTIRQVARKEPPPVPADGEPKGPVGPADVDPNKPIPDPSLSSARRIPPREQLAQATIGRARTAERLMRITKADDMVRVKGGYRLVYNDIPYTEPEPPLLTPPSPKGPKPKPVAGVESTIQGQRPFVALKDKDKQSLIPIIQKAMEQGFDGDVEQLGDELAERLTVTREGRIDAEHSGRASSGLVQAIKKLGGISEETEKIFSGEVKWLKETPLKKMGVFSKKAGLSLDGALEGLKQDGRFPHINNTNDLLEELRKAGETGISVDDAADLAKGLGEGWWSKFSKTPYKPKPVEDVPVVTPKPKTVKSKVVEPKATSNLSPLGKDLEDISERTGVTSGQKPFEPGSTSKPEGVVLSATENKEPGKLSWNRSEFPAKPIREASVKPPRASAAQGKAATDVANGRIPDRRASNQGPTAGMPDRRVAELAKKYGGTAADSPAEAAVRPDANQAAIVEASSEGTPDWVKAQLDEIEKLKNAQNPAPSSESPLSVQDFASQLAAEGQKPIAEAPFSLEAPTAKPSGGKMDSLFKGQKGEIPFGVMPHLAGAGIGAATGAGMDKENRLRGAAIGAGLGLAGTGAISMIPSLLERLPQMQEGQTAKDLVEPVVSRFPNYMRGGLLSDPRSAFHNAVLGPWGSQTLGGTELFLKGLASGDERQNIGKEVLKRAGPVSWVKNFLSRRKEAVEKIHDVEQGSRAGTYQDVRNPTFLDRVMEEPAVDMLMGDLTSRANLSDAGVSDDLAQQITLTNEPRRAITRGLANLTKTKGGIEGKGQTSVIAKTMQPFVRTAANILESGTERTPILGYLLNTFGDESLRIPGRDILVQQGMGGVVWGLGFGAGQLTDEDAGRALRIHSAISNLGGQYSLLANAGFMAGQAVKKGKPVNDAFWDATKKAYLTEGFPLPTTQPLAEGLNLIKKATTDPGDLGLKDIPGVAVPSAVKFVAGELQEKPGSVREWLNKSEPRGQGHAPRSGHTPRSGSRYVPRRRRQQ